MRYHSVQLARLLALLLLAPLGRAADQQLPGDVPAEYGPADQGLAAAFDVERATVQSLVLPQVAEGPLLVEVQLGAQLALVELAPVSVRADGFRLLVENSRGVLVEQPAPPSRTVRGYVIGMPGSLVAGSLVDGGLTAFVRLTGELGTYGIQPLRAVDALAPAERHIVFHELDSIPADVECGVGQVDGTVRELRGPTLRGQGDAGLLGGITTSGSAGAGPGGLGGHLGGTQIQVAGQVQTTRVCELACDADVEFYQRNGSSVSVTTNDIENVINGVSAVYQSTVDTVLEVTAVIVRTSEPDPYGTSNASSLLARFRDEWRSNHTGVHRDLAHLFTGRNIDGSTIGIAYLNGLCSSWNGFGLSQSRYTNNFTSRVGLTAHEVGHNWGASHCDGQSDCKIMCSGLGGCAGSVASFGSSAASTLDASKDRACIDLLPPLAPPVIASVTPPVNQTFLPDPFTIEGANLFQVTEVRIGDEVLGVGSGILSREDDRLVFMPPTPTAIGDVELTLVNGAGESNTATVTYFDVEPQLVNPLATYAGSVFEWDFGGRANDSWAIFIQIGDGTTFSYMGFDVLLNSFQLLSGNLDAAGLGRVSIVVPGGLSSIVFHSQLLTFDAFSGDLSGSSQTRSTWILF